MSLKALIYCLTVPIVIWALDSLNINAIFKKNRYYASRVFYLVLAIGLSYLVVNFFFDFFTSSIVVK